MYAKLSGRDTNNSATPSKTNAKTTSEGKVLAHNANEELYDLEHNKQHRQQQRRKTKKLDIDGNASSSGVLAFCQAMGDALNHSLEESGRLSRQVAIVDQNAQILDGNMQSTKDQLFANDRNGTCKYIHRKYIYLQSYVTRIFVCSSLLASKSYAYWYFSRFCLFQNFQFL